MSVDRIYRDLRRLPPGKRCAGPRPETDLPRGGGSDVTEIVASTVGGPEHLGLPAAGRSVSPKARQRTLLTNMSVDVLHLLERDGCATQIRALLSAGGLNWPRASSLPSAACWHRRRMHRNGCRGEGRAGYSARPVLEGAAPCLPIGGLLGDPTSPTPPTYGRTSEAPSPARPRRHAQLGAERTDGPSERRPHHHRCRAVVPGGTGGRPPGGPAGLRRTADPATAVSRRMGQLPPDTGAPTSCGLAGIGRRGGDRRSAAAEHGRLSCGRRFPPPSAPLARRPDHGADLCYALRPGRAGRSPRCAITTWLTDGTGHALVRGRAAPADSAAPGAASGSYGNQQVLPGPARQPRRPPGDAPRSVRH